MKKVFLIVLILFTYSCGTEDSNISPYESRWIDDASWVSEVKLITHDPSGPIARENYQDEIFAVSKSINLYEKISIYNHEGSEVIKSFVVGGIFYDPLRAACYIADTDLMPRNYLVVEGCDEGIKLVSASKVIKPPPFNTCDNDFENTPCITPYGERICSDEIEYSDCLFGGETCTDRSVNHCEVIGEKCSYLVQRGDLVHFENLMVKSKVEVCNPESESCEAPKDCGSDIDTLKKFFWYSPRFTLPGDKNEF